MEGQAKIQGQDVEARLLIEVRVGHICYIELHLNAPTHGTEELLDLALGEHRRAHIEVVCQPQQATPLASSTQAYQLLPTLSAPVVVKDLMLHGRRVDA